MDKRQLGRTGPSVSQFGLGCLGMSELYGPADHAEGVATIHAAFDDGLTLLDTGDFYGQGHNELLIAEATAGRPRDSFQISLKFGATREPSGAFTGVDGRPSSAKNFLAYSLRRLGTEHVDVYRLCRTDPAVPIEETVGAIAEMVQAGYVRHIGLSEADADTIRRAATVHPISDLQAEYSLLNRSLEDEVLPLCRDLGIAITAYGILSLGLLSQHAPKAGDVGADDLRAHSPRFRDENLATNASIVDALTEVADGLGTGLAQLAIAWVAAQGDDMIPLIGARRRSRWAEALAAADVVLDADTLAAIERIVPRGAGAGTMYAGG